MNNIDSAMRDGFTDECPKQCAYCKRFLYLGGHNPVGVCEAAFDEWQDTVRNAPTCVDALAFFSDYTVMDDAWCARSKDFEEND